MLGALAGFMPCANWLFAHMMLGSVRGSSHVLKYRDARKLKQAGQTHKGLSGLVKAGGSRETDVIVCIGQAYKPNPEVLLHVREKGSLSFSYLQHVVFFFPPLSVSLLSNLEKHF